MPIFCKHAASFPTVVERWYVCRPGSGENYTRDDGSAQAQEDKHVHAIAKQIEGLTGEKPTVVTHHDRDAVGKIACFRRATNPYLVAVNMVSEGCDIPRIRAVAFCLPLHEFGNAFSPDRRIFALRMQKGMMTRSHKFICQRSRS